MCTLTTLHWVSRIQWCVNQNKWSATLTLTDHIIMYYSVLVSQQWLLWLVTDHMIHSWWCLCVIIVWSTVEIADTATQHPQHINGLLISLWSSSEYGELSGIVNVPLRIASVCSPNGVVKKHNLYNKQPRAWDTTLTLNFNLYLLGAYPYITAHCNRLAWVKVNHLRSSVCYCCESFDLLFTMSHSHYLQ